MAVNTDETRATFLQQMLGHLITFGAEVNKHDDGGLLIETLLRCDAREEVELVLAAPRLELDLHLEVAVEFITQSEEISELGSDTVCVLLRKGN